MKLRKHSNGKFYAHLTGGKEINLRSSNRTEALKLAKEAKLEEIEFAAKAKLLNSEAILRLSTGTKMTCESAIDEWKEWATTIGLTPNTIYQNETYQRLFFTDAGLLNKSVGIVTEKHADTFVNSSTVISASTRRYRLAALNNFFKFCLARGYAITDPTALIRVKMDKLTFEQKEVKERVPFTSEELDKLSRLEDPFWRAAVLLGYEAGLRIGDVAKLEWASVGPMQVTVWTDKHDKRVSVPISAELFNMLKGLPREHETFVFPEQARTAGDAKTRSKLSVYFGRVLQKQGIEGKGFHCLRHTFATKHRQLGQSVDEIREMLGHSDSKTTQLYIHAEHKSGKE